MADENPYIWIDQIAFMKHQRRIRGKMSGEIFKASFLLLVKSGLQEPKCTLPSDDESLAKLADVTPKQWESFKKIALYSWTLRPDGRLKSFLVKAEMPEDL